MRVELRIEAREDLAEGAEFYDRQRPGLGDYFIESVLADLEALQSLGSHAAIHEVIFGFHRKLATRFPFAIYYLVVGPLIDVVAVLDCRRDPAKLECRLRQTRP